MEKTIKETRGTVGERQTAFVNALKAVDYEKEYQQAFRDLAEAMFDMEFDDNNKPIVSLNDTK